MDQSAITQGHLDTDGIHLNYYGNTLLKYNILSVFRTFDPARMNFHNDYREACF